MSDKTREIDIGRRDEEAIRQIIMGIYNALEEKGYDPINQLVGFILSDDPTYITTHKGARNQIRRIDRYELLQIILNDFISDGIQEKKSKEGTE